MINQTSNKAGEQTNHLYMGATCISMFNQISSKSDEQPHTLYMGFMNKPFNTQSNLYFKA